VRPSALRAAPGRIRKITTDAIAAPNQMALKSSTPATLAAKSSPELTIEFRATR
jgi:hypothetical protein